MAENSAMRYFVVLDGNKVGPYDRRTVIGMRIKKVLGNDHVLIGEDGEQLTVGKLLAVRPSAQRPSTMSSSGLMISFPVRFGASGTLGRGAFGFKGEGEARLQPGFLRIAGQRRKGLIGTAEARVKVPLGSIREIELDHATVRLRLAESAPFEASEIKHPVVLILDSPNAAAELHDELAMLMA